MTYDIYAKWRGEDALIKQIIIDYIGYRMDTLPDHIILENLVMRHLFINEADLAMYKEMIRHDRKKEVSK